MNPLEWLNDPYGVQRNMMGMSEREQYNRLAAQAAMQAQRPEYVPLDRQALANAGIGFGGSLDSLLPSQAGGRAVDPYAVSHESSKRIAELEKKLAYAKNDYDILEMSCRSHIESNRHMHKKLMETLAQRQTAPFLVNHVDYWRGFKWGMIAGILLAAGATIGWMMI